MKLPQVRFVVRGSPPDETNPAHDGLTEVSPWCVYRQISEDDGETWDDDDRWDVRDFLEKRAANAEVYACTGQSAVGGHRPDVVIGKADMARLRRHVALCWSQALPLALSLYASAALPGGTPGMSVILTRGASVPVAFIPFTEVRGGESRREIREQVRRWVRDREDTPEAARQAALQLLEGP